MISARKRDASKTSVLVADMVPDPNRDFTMGLNIFVWSMMVVGFRR